MTNDKQFCLGFTHFDPRSAFFWSIVGHCAKEEAERLGVKLISKPAPNSTDQIIEIQKLLEQKIDALLITPIESGHPGLINVIETVNAAGIPVVALDSGVGGGEVMSTVRSDNIKGEEMVTEYIFERLGGKGKVIHLQGDLKVEVGAHRSEGFHNVLSRYPEIELVFEAEGNWYRDRGAELTQQALTKHPDIQAVIAANDLTALGASDAIAKVGRTKEILVSGFDALPEALVSIHEGQITATVQQDADGMAREALEAAIQGIQGETVPSLLLTKVELITLDNLLKTTVNGLHMLPGVLRNLEEQKREISKANTMLEQHRNQLEQLVAGRTHQLEVAATLGGRLNAILNFDQLLAELVNQIKENFDYYHAHIYMFDDTGQNLVVAAGTGNAGKQMMADSHSIPISAPTSLVARAARSGEIVTVQNVQAAEDWLPNPLLPKTRAEMAVPILQAGQVIGILDVQEDEVAGLDEGDANLLRSLASHVAVAITNARLFEQNTQAKEEAEQSRKEAEFEKASAEAAREEAEQSRKETEAANQSLSTQMWQTKGQAQLNDKMRGEQDIETLANNVIDQLCEYLPAATGALYIMENDSLYRAGHYAYNANGATRFKLREGLVGQAAAKKQPLFLTDIPTDHLTVRSGFGEATLRHVMVFPFMYEGLVGGVIELGTLTKFNQTQIDFMDATITNIGIAFNTALVRARVNELLAETQQQAEELQTQGEELRVANEELQAQTESLQVSEAKLKKQQAELETTNTQLEEKAAALEESSSALKEKQNILDQQNRELMVAQEELERKAKELALASKYKSEFLANMSHELRTPLNSLLILARMLADNKDGNLTEEQVESSQIIYSGGTDLLNLINDILDLSKVEAGQMIFTFEAMPLTDLVSTMRMQFDHVAEEKGPDFIVNLAEDLPGRINTDQQRVKQIIKNLLSNAFKFTKEGSVSLNLYRPDSNVDLSRSGLDPSETIAISVADSGIGMTSDQLKVIFEAFQQADGSTSRQYGGTGLGLSICRELAANLGGQIEVESTPGQGSTFTLYLPIEKQADDDQKTTESQPKTAGKKQATAKPKQKSKKHTSPPPAPETPPRVVIADDRDQLSDNDKILLVIEDDPKFAKIMLNHAHKKTFKCLVAGDGRSGLQLVNTYQPHAIILDLNLPDISGWEVLEVLKNDPATRHIPVHIMSVDDEDLTAYKKGAMGYLTKPVSQENLDHAFGEIEHFISQDIKTLLLVEDDASSRLSVKKLLDGSDVQINEAETGQQALDLLRAQHYDCMILDLSLPDMSGFAVLNKINADEQIAKCPIIVYTGRDLTPEENDELMKYANRVIVKGVKSPERLLDETALFLHRVVADMPKEKQQTIKQLYNKDGLLQDKKIMIVDDDMRNSFALSKLLSEKGVIVKIARDGQKALDMLAEDADIDLILMDVMMPVLDGYETAKRIRAQRKFKTLPILALTAKAMKGDREKCLEAGANDYLSKPIDIDRLFSMLQVWLYR